MIDPINDAPVRVVVFKRPQRDLNNRGIQMLGAAADSLADVNQEEVSIVGKPSKQRRLVSDDGRKVARQLSGVIGRRAPKHNLMRNPIDVKMKYIVFANLDR